MGLGLPVIDESQRTFLNLEFDLLFPLKKVLGGEESAIVTSHLTFLALVQLLFYLHKLRMGQVEPLRDARQIDQLVFVVDEAKLLAHLVLLSQVD